MEKRSKGLQEFMQRQENLREVKKLIPQIEIPLNSGLSFTELQEIKECLEKIIEIKLGIK